MTNDNRDADNRLANSNKEAVANQQLKATEAENETGFKRVPLDVNQPDKQKDLIELNWYLGISNAVYKKAKINTNKLVNGEKKAIQVEKSVFDHYDFPYVGTTPFEDWLKQKFGDNVRVDKKTLEVYTLVPEGQQTDNAPTPQPNIQTNTEETQVQNNQENNDPENN